MEPVRPEFVPDASLSHEEMEAQQRAIATQAAFEDRVDFDPDSVAPGEGPVVAGVDQGFSDDTATSAIVLMQNDEVVDRVHATVPTASPYIPGLLSFREGGAILAAFAKLATEPDVVLLDGSGRIHYREAGIAVHIGVTLDVPTVGVAKALLCGQPAEPLDDPLPAGSRIPILATDEVTAANGTVIGYALQTRQYEGPDRYINPLYVSPGHRVGAETAVDVVERHATGYKLPEPVRLADAYVGKRTG